MPAPRISRRGLLAAGAAALAAPALLPPGTASAAAGYIWRNAQIVGGGFVPGIVFNQRERNLVDARTDIGGAYRMDCQANRWVPLLDWVGWDDWGHTGVISLATDEVDPDRVYAAVGTYTIPSWDPTLGAVLRSTNRGRTWKASPLPFRLGGNMPGRGIGERLAIDPNRNSILYLGVRGGNGLWRSTDSGATWARVASFPNVGTFVPDPSDTSGYSADNLGVLQVIFDRRTARAGQATKTIYVTVADTGNILYRSTDAGTTWTRVPGQPTGYIPHKAVFDHAGGYLYLATSDTAGPYDGGKGDVWKLDTATGTWTLISPVPSTSGDDGWGYSGLSIDRQHPGTIMVSTQISWWPDIVIFRSTDAGATWTRSWDWGAYPDRILRYSIDISAAPWLTWNATPAPPELAPKLGWMTESLEIDPFNSDRFLYGTGATIYGADNLTAWDTGGTIAISVRAQGLEETSVQDLISPPTGAHLLSAVGDVGGFVHTDLDRATTMFDHPTTGTATSLDYAGQAPNVIVRAGNGSGEYFGISTDGGTTWTPAGSNPAGTSAGGLVAVNADGRRIVWSPGGSVVSYSTDSGATWSASAGLPAGTPVEADRVDPAKFYALSAGAFFISTDGGVTFTPTAAAGLPTTGNVRFAAVPGKAGDVWIAGGSTDGAYGLWHSTTAGASFDRLSHVDQADTVGFGRAAPGHTYPAVFISARIAGVRGIFRSDTGGTTWVRVNDDQHQYGWTGAAITGDPRIYGRVYLGTNGRGVIYGDLR
jgi:xyloglucan-specific exo-beta-1,4-glucanase